jgi:hypothetical protein
MLPDNNPCLSCGACCAYFRASFYWGEGDDVPGGTVPVRMTAKLNDFRIYMQGTNGPNPRCIALLGAIGEGVRCSIYPLRASICRDFPFSWSDGTKNERCDAARLAWGLEPLSPDSIFDNTPTAPPLPKAA